MRHTHFYVNVLRYLDIYALNFAFFFLPPPDAIMHLVIRMYVFSSAPFRTLIFRLQGIWIQ